MKTLIGVILALLASAGLVAKEVVVQLDNGVVIEFSDQPCSNEVILAMIKPGLHAAFQSGHATYEGRTVNLCWSGTVMPGFVAVADEDGSTGLIPAEALKAPNAI